MLAVAFDTTAVVETVNVPVVAPAAIVADPVVVADALSEAVVTVRPPVGAGLLIVTVAIELVPPVTEVGARVTDETVGAVMASAPLALLPLADAEIFAVTFAPTATVVIVAVPVVAPAAIVIGAGAIAAALSEAIVTVNPPAGAGEPIVTVAVEEVPPTTGVGLSVTVVTLGPVTPRVAVPEVPLMAAVIVADKSAATATVVIGNVADVCPAVIVTDAGTVTEGELDVRAIISPAGAALEIVTVPVEVPVVPPTTVVGATVRLTTLGALIWSAAPTVVAAIVALMFAVAFVVMPEVVTVKLAELEPAAIFTEPGT